MKRSTKRFISFKNYLLRSYICVCFQVVAFVREHFVIYKAFYLDLVQGYMNGAPKETWTHSSKFFESHGLVSPMSKKPCKLLNVLWQKQQAGNIHVYKNEINNY